jgi:hypothetical protein
MIRNWRPAAEGLNYFCSPILTAATSTPQTVPMPRELRQYSMRAREESQRQSKEPVGSFPCGPALGVAIADGSNLWLDVVANTPF